VTKGALVRLVKRTRWGGVSTTNRVGVILNQKYLAYDDTRSKWNVLISGCVVTLQTSQMIELE